jgi:serine transporter
LTRFVLSGRSGGDITQVVEEHFGIKAGALITVLYFFAIFPILLIYSVALTNTVSSFMEHQLHIAPPPRVILSFVLILGLLAIVRCGEQATVKVMSLLVYPFIVALALLALYLVPHWTGGILDTASQVPSGSAFLHTVWLAIPVMVFSFNHSPIISAFAVDQKRRYGDHADERSGQILRRAHLLMVVMVLFFVFSCVLTLSSAQLAEAKAQNLSILSYLANHFDQPTIAFAAPLIAFMAIAKSFLGHYIGASEGLKGMIVKTGLRPGAKALDRGRRTDAGGVLDRRHPQPEHPRHDRVPRWPDHRRAAVPDADVRHPSRAVDAQVQRRAVERVRGCDRPGGPDLGGVWPDRLKRPLAIKNVRVGCATRAFFVHKNCLAIEQFHVCL